MATNLVGEINSRNGVHGVRAINGSCDIDHANSTKGYKGVDNVKGIKGSSNISGPITVHATHDVSTTELETTVSGLFSTNSIDGENLGKGYIDHAKHSNPLASTHSLLVYKLFQKLQAITRDGNVKVNGESLDVPTVVAVSKYDFLVKSSIDPQNRIR